LDDKSSITGEVEKRLNDLFNEDNDVSAPEEITEDIKDSPLLRLKEIVLSIDWEITDDVMTSMISEVEELKTRYDDDRIIVLFLELLASVGRYIKKNKANSHPDAIKLLNSIYRSLEKIVSYDAISESEKKKTLFTQINRFKKLKQKIALKKKEMEQEKRFKPPEPPAISEGVSPTIPLTQGESPVISQESLSPSVSEQAEEPHINFKGMAPHEAFAYALEEIRKLIKAEFQALKAELKLWREGRF
jgi:hypothetical protein